MIERCKNCGQRIELINFTMGPEWRHWPSEYGNYRTSEKYRYCVTSSVAEPVTAAVGTKAPEEPKTFEEHFVCVKADNIVYAQGFCYCENPDFGPHSITLDRKKPAVGTNNEEGN